MFLRKNRSSWKRMRDVYISQGFKEKEVLQIITNPKTGFQTAQEVPGAIFLESGERMVGVTLNEGIAFIPVWCRGNWYE